MSLLVFKNLAASTLAGSIDASTTTINLASGGGAAFPNPAAGQYFVICVTDAATGLLLEIMYVTAVAGDALTVVRAQESTAALTWSAGDNVRSLWTAGQAATMIQRAQLQQQADNYVVAGGSANAITLTLPLAPGTLASLIGMPVRFKALATNTASVTITINGYGPITIYTPISSTLAPGQIFAGGVYTVIYDGTYFQLQTITEVPGRYFGTDVGSANNIVVSIPEMNYVAVGQLFTVLVAATNTGATTMALNGITYEVFRLGLPLLHNVLIGGLPYSFVYDGTNMCLQSMTATVQSGTGTGMNTNQVMLGWNGADLLGQVDAAALGALAFKPWVLGLTNGNTNYSDIIAFSVTTPIGIIVVNGFHNITGTTDSTGHWYQTLPFALPYTRGVFGSAACAVNGATLEYGQIVQIGPTTLTTAQVSFYNPGGTLGQNAGVSAIFIGI